MRGPLQEIKEQLNRIERKVEAIMSEQSAEQASIDAATAEETAEAADLQGQETALAQVVTEIQALQSQGVNVTALASATASLVTAQGADDTVVQQLTAAANPAPTTPTTPTAA